MMTTDAIKSIADSWLKEERDWMDEETGEGPDYGPIAQMILLYADLAERLDCLTELVEKLTEERRVRGCGQEDNFKPPKKLEEKGPS